MSTNKLVNKVVIAGGGTAGWMAAATISATIGRRLDVTLIESDAIPTVGVGEATVPSLLTIHQLLKIHEADFLEATNATYKLGIMFENWTRLNHKYFHSFGNSGMSCWAAGFHHFWVRAQQQKMAKDYADYSLETLAAEKGKFAHMQDPNLNYAYHLDSSKYGQFLRGIAEKHGVKRVEGKIDNVNLDPQSGHIESIRMESGQVIDGDLFIDCTGFRSLLLGEALGVGYNDWSEMLPANAAYAVQTQSHRPAVPYTRSIALDAGWRWQIPLQHRVGNGVVFSTNFKSEQSALDDLLQGIDGEPITDPRLIRFTTGQRKEFWHKNCVSVGLSSGFIEPLESTSIHLIQQAIIWLISLFPTDGIDTNQVNRFNQQMTVETETIRDFIVLHYHLQERDDHEFWRYLREMKVSDRLQQILNLFQNNGTIVEEQDDLFAENSWVQVMMGQGLIPKQYHPIVDMMGDRDLNMFMRQQENVVQQTVSRLPSHTQFIQHFLNQPRA
ncbi:tryptophan 7-halogenase [Alteromonas sp. ASW11-36]|uniref:Tryptophan 7-halogenase n=1 Tax=Alteromonas arenosi TaxID=3055817 RepID=A0ABT7SW31_9ALTE|nr:tryptophan halogenase family protein [Alteromonas sp. ASW11-36]MDM7860393.1 tryptophan 7-halogenase [Alteromonas sp. ASW11-36]